MTNKWKQNLKLLKSLFYKVKLYNKIIAFPHATEGLEMIVITIYCFNVSYHMFQLKDDPSRSFNCSMFCFEFDQLSNILWTKNLIQLTLIVTINLKMTLNVLTVNNARKSETEMKIEFLEKSSLTVNYTDRWENFCCLLQAAQQRIFMRRFYMVYSAHLNTTI